MPLDMNRVILCGRLGADPEEKGSGDKSFVTLRVATNRRVKKGDAYESVTDWHSVTLFAKPAANFAARYLKKGSQVLVEGMLETRERDGKYFTSVVVRPYEGSISGQSGTSGGDSEGGGRRANDREDRSRSEDRGGMGAGSAFAPEDDDIPFAPEWRG